MRTLFLILLMSLAPVGAAAQTIEDQVTQQLLAQGYDDITFSRTLLRRLRVVALSDTTERELILNPTTGQILRDRAKPLTEDGETNVTISQSPSSTHANSDDTATPPPPRPPRDAGPSGPPPPRTGGH